MKAGIVGKFYDWVKYVKKLRLEFILGSPLLSTESSTKKKISTNFKIFIVKIHKFVNNLISNDTN